MRSSMRLIGRRAVTGLETALLTEQKPQFILREIATQLGSKRIRRQVYEYRLHNGLPIGLNHAGMDHRVLFEIFHEREYEAPEQLQPLIERRDIRILDLGGNVGYFAVWVATQFPGALLTAFEADPENAKRYELTLRMLSEPEWRVINAFAGVDNGEVRFLSGLGARSRRSVDGDGTDIPCTDIFPYLEQVDLVKMDIEGGEWEILADPRFTRVGPNFVVLEFHSHLCPSKDPHEEIRRLAETNGYALFAGRPESHVAWLYRER